MTDQKNRRILITSALPYVNNVPHLGNVVGCVLSADVYARYMRSKNTDEILFVGGVDEYGTATEMKAGELGITCKELCDKNYDLHRSIYDWFRISFDCYGRTSQPNGKPEEIDHKWPQTSITHEIYKSLCRKNLIIEKEEKTMYCPAIKKYVADRFVIGTCRHCGSTRADGDQCDQCGNLLSPDDIIDPLYKPNTEYKLEVKTIKNLFIDTNKIWQDNQMTKWFEKNCSHWSKNATSITQQWLKMGLEPRSITRDLEWGTVVPDTEQFGSSYNKKVFYVWFDAPIGYISIMEKCLGKERSEKWWKDRDVQVVEFMAKDNVPFHSIIFPVTLKGSEYSNIDNLDIVSTEYLMYEGKKFSKSKGTGLFCDDVVKLSKQYNLDPDYWRAYLIFIRPENGDSNFSLNGGGGFVDFINNILIGNIGNLVHRVLSIAFQIQTKHSIKSIPINDKCEQNNFDEELQTIVKEYHGQMNAYKLMDGLKIVLKFSAKLNGYINQTEPWKLLKSESEKDNLYQIIQNLYRNIVLLGRLLEPFMPNIAKTIIVKFISGDSDSIVFPTEKPSVLINPIEKLDF